MGFRMTIYPADKPEYWVGDDHKGCTGDYVLSEDDFNAFEVLYLKDLKETNPGSECIRACKQYMDYMSRIPGNKVVYWG